VIKSRWGISILDKNIPLRNMCPMTLLSKYLKEHRIAQADFATSVGVTQSVVSRMASGATKPGLDLAVRIERATLGLVPAACWVDAKPKVTPEPAEDAPEAVA
jgi:transcriptional regulator with XRE-family HTH domain